MIHSLLHRLSPVTPGETPARNHALEGMRGVCALLVFVAHLFLPFRVLDPRWTPSDWTFAFNLGYPAVLMFFVLSGYVIGLTTTGPARPAEIRHYLARRATRLVPLNTIVVLVCWLLLGPVAIRTISGNLLFLQNDDAYPLLGVFPVLANNPNIWSLNYEAVYYLVFIGVWYWAPSTLLVFSVMVALVCARALGLPLPLVFARYACGGLFWFAGLAIAWTKPPDQTPVTHSHWLTAALIAYSIWIFAPLKTLCSQYDAFNWVWPAPTPVSPHRLDFLPPCIWLLLAVTRNAPKLQRFFSWLCLGLATTGLLERAVFGNWQRLDAFALAALVGGLALFRFNFSLNVLRALAPVGRISFGLYVIAAPVQLSQRSLFTSFSGSPGTFTVRLIGVVIVAVTSAWILERKICPWVVHWLRSHQGKGVEG